MSSPIVSAESIGMRFRSAMKIEVLTIALVALSQSVFAQQPPSAGGQIQQIPPPPIQQRTPPEIQIDKGGAPTLPVADDVKIIVNKLQVSGQTVYSESELLATTGFKPGSESNLAQLRATALKIADHYHSNGYFVAQVFLPAQDIKDGAVTFTVIEGRYGKVTLRNSTNLSDSLVNSRLGGLNSGDIIAIAPLEERLLLLSDIPGVIVKSTLVPGASLGTSDLIVDVTPGQRVTGSVEADNAGNRYTGVNRIGATTNINNLTGHGDVAALRVLTSGPGLTYARASYQVMLGRATAGVAYSLVDYRLGMEFSNLQAHGTAEIGSIYGSYPLIRSRNTSLYATVAFDAKKFQDKVDSTAPPGLTDKNARLLMMGLNGDHRDGLGGGGYSGYSATWTTGDIDIRTPVARAADAATAQSNGNFNKLGFQAMRLQNLGGPFSLYAAIRGQVATKNLDVSEKMELGGVSAVRAYPEGEAYADEGYVVNLEAKMLLPKPSERMPGQVQLIGFADTGSVTPNRNPWTGGQTSRTLSGAGMGLTWEDYNNFSVKAYWAHKMGSAIALSVPDAASRFWVQFVKYF